MTSTLSRTCRRGAERCRFGLVLVLLAVVAALAAAPAPAQDPPLKIAVVNLEFIASQSPSGKALQSRLEEFSKTVQAQLAALDQERSALRQQIADGANSLSEEKLLDLQKQFEDKGTERRRYQEDKQREGQKMQEEGLKQIERELEPIFEQIRDERSLDLILNNVPGVVVMAGSRVDITQAVLDKLQAAASSG